MNATFNIASKEIYLLTVDAHVVSWIMNAIPEVNVEKMKLA